MLHTPWPDAPGEAYGPGYAARVAAPVRSRQYGRCLSTLRQPAGGTEMSFARIMALASRIIRQVLRDKRTLALIFIVPILIMTLLYFVLTSTSSVHTLAIVQPTRKSTRLNSSHQIISYAVFCLKKKNNDLRE